jgi:hypothetical protein
VNITISPPIRILALVGLIAIVAFGASTMLLGHSSNATRTSTAQPHSGRRVNNVAPKTPVHTAAKPHANVKTPAKTHASVATHPKTTTKAHAKTATKPAKPKPRGNLVYADLPAPLQWQLALHEVVVVTLYNPNADVDAISVAEAHAGALDAGAGFLLVSVLDNAVAGPLTALLPGGGLLPDPGVLVYRAPGDILVRLDGFADRTTVAQAVANALAPGSTPARSAPAATIASGTTGAPSTTVTP